MTRSILAEAVHASDIATRVGELRSAIAQDYHGRRPVFVGVLTGSLWFLSDLVKGIDLEVDVDFLALNRFGEGGRIRIAMDTATPLTGRDVILVEDIVDTGLSLTVLRRMLEDREVASLSTVALLDKTTRRLVDVPLEYRGFEVGDEYLVGYGLDHEGLFRNARSLWVILDLPAFQADPTAFAAQVIGTS